MPKGIKNVYAPEVVEYVREHYKGRTHKELVDMIYRDLGIVETPRRIESLKAKNKWNSGLTGCFEKGSTPWNKGVTGYMGANKTSFVKGQYPPNTRAVGEERVNRDGLIEVKITDDRSVSSKRFWKSKHAYLWEQYNGQKIPPNHVVIFADCNNRNFDKDNLILVSRAELLYMNRHNLIYKDTELTKAGVLIARLNVMANKKGKR